MQIQNQMDKLIDALTSVENYKQGTKPFKESAASNPEVCQLINDAVLQVLNKGKPLQKLLALKVIFKIYKKLVKDTAELNIQSFHRLLQDQILKIISDYASFNKDDQFENLYMIPQEQAQLCHSIYRLSCDLIRVWAARYPNSKFSKTYFNLLTDGVTFPELKYYSNEQLYEVVDLHKEAKELINQLNNDKIKKYSSQIDSKNEVQIVMLNDVQEKLQQQLKQVDQTLINLSQSDQLGLIQDLLDKQEIIQKQLIQINLQIKEYQYKFKLRKQNTTPNIEIRESSSQVRPQTKVKTQTSFLKLTQESDINDEQISEKFYQNERSFDWQQQTVDFQLIQENNTNQYGHNQQLEAAQLLIDDLQMKYNLLQKDFNLLKEICFQKDVQLLKQCQQIQILQRKVNDLDQNKETNIDNNNKIFIQQVKAMNATQEPENITKESKGRLINYCFKQVQSYSKQQTSLCIFNRKGLLFQKKQIQIYAKIIPNEQIITLYFYNTNGNDEQVEIQFQNALNIKIIEPNSMSTRLNIKQKSSQIFNIRYKIVDQIFGEQLIKIKLLKNNKDYELILPISLYNHLDFEQLTLNELKSQWKSNNQIFKTDCFNYDLSILNEFTPITSYIFNLILLNDGYQMALQNLKFGGAFKYKQQRYLIKFRINSNNKMTIQLNTKDQSNDLSEFILSSFQFLFS